MGILKYAVEETKTITINDANNVPMVGDDGHDVVFEIYGPGSKQYAKAQSKKTARIMNLAKQQAKIQGNPELDAIEDANFFADIVKTSPSNIGDDFPGLSGRQLLIALFTTRSLGFICEQINREISAWSNFIKPSTTN